MAKLKMGELKTIARLEPTLTEGLPTFSAGSSFTSTVSDTQST